MWQSVPIQIRLVPRPEPSFDSVDGGCASADKMLLPRAEVGGRPSQRGSIATRCCSFAEDAQVGLPKLVERARRAGCDPEHGSECDARETKRQRDGCSGLRQVSEVVGWGPSSPDRGGEL